MQYYQAKVGKLAGTDFREAHKNARKVYDEIRKKSKRKPHIRSKYFNKNKIFLDLFWSHLYEKRNLKDRLRRVRYYGVAIELMVNTLCKPESKENPNDRSEILHRFTGKTKNGEIFYVQIKEEKRSGHKYFISVFPDK